MPRPPFGGVHALDVIIVEHTINCEINALRELIEEMTSLMMYVMTTDWIA